ncbi:DUF342 domain-containing protein [Ningiella sp. W23]|uniref:DUF342 domain-containing protein n=1 Tax=Ningiella sp. W23 TaxID=3023715 RepID=UPI00375826EA
MSGTSFKTDIDSDNLIALVDPLLFEGTCDEMFFHSALASSEFSACALDVTAITELASAIQDAKDAGDMSVIEKPIGTLPSNGIVVELSEDNMEATVRIFRSDDAALPDFASVLKALTRNGVTRGISKKRIQNLINNAQESEKENEFSDVVAIGLPSRNGKPSRVIPLVPNALDRILRPQVTGDEQVDMRNLGDILCVPSNHPVAMRAEPTEGRAGYTVTNLPLPAEKGEWKEIKLGDNTKFDPDDANLIVSELSGQPKFINEVMNIDDTYVTKGVNVGTGNVKYEGAVIVNGDVTENMQIIATGDITINGFVESAYIESGGDIIVTQGATGKMNEEDCIFKARGSVFVQHGQGLNISTGKDINVKRQLAYSRIHCQGNIYVGDPDNPMGNLFASTITAYGTVKAGSIGAISGSALEIDFSEGFNVLKGRLEAINDLLEQLVSVNVDHEIEFSNISARKIPTSLTKKFKRLDGTLTKERALLTWLRKLHMDLEQALTDYKKDARVIANKEMFPGLSVKLNKRLYKAKKETLKSRVLLVNENWEYQPIIERR